MHAALDDAEQRRAIVAMRLLRALGPAQGQLHGTLGHIEFGRIRRALVKDHHDVRTQVALHLHRLFRPHEHLGAIHRRGEIHPLLLDLAHRPQAEHLEATGVGEDRPLPLHEIVQIAVTFDHLGARAQPQVEGIAEDHLRAYRLDVARQHALDRAIGAHRHERRRLDHATGKGEAPAPRLAIGRQQFERHPAGARHR
ncbi:hypothetical protein D3C71_1564470 [compost metagenome]